MELSLDNEVENIRNIQERMRETLDLANSQVSGNVIFNILFIVCGYWTF